MGSPTSSWDGWNLWMCSFTSVRVPMKAKIELHLARMFFLRKNHTCDLELHSASSYSIENSYLEPKYPLSPDNRVTWIMVKWIWDSRLDLSLVIWILASRFGFEPWGWDLSPEARIWAPRLEFESARGGHTEREKKEKFREKIGHWPLLQNTS